jgi:hypothetical protein
MTILAKIESAGYDVFHRRPSLGRWEFLKLYLRARRGFPVAAVYDRRDALPADRRSQSAATDSTSHR